jgi:hypothetical protein
VKFLLDTNILIPAEPTSPADAEPTTPLVTKLVGLLAEARCEAFIHPASIAELREDRDADRRNLRQQLLDKYVRLPAPPAITSAITDVLRVPVPGSNTETDTQLLAAVLGNAVDFLVTSDDRIHRHAARLDLTDRVLTPEDALATTRALIPARPVAPPAVQPILCHELNASDRIFDSLRVDYPGFDDWLGRCQREHRRGFLITSREGHAGVAIIKPEESGEHGLQGKVLKICALKVRSSAASEIARFVGHRTVYTLEQIDLRCRKETLAILFRQSRTIPRVKLAELVEQKVLRAAPQQITRIRPEGVTWIRQYLEA